MSAVLKPIGEHVNALVCLREWRKAEAAYKSQRMPAEAFIEQRIIEAINAAQKAGLTQLSADLAHARTSVDGAAQQYYSARNALIATIEAMKTGLVGLRYDLRSYRGLEELRDLVCDETMADAIDLHGFIDGLQEMAVEWAE